MDNHLEVTPERMREILGHFCTGLTIITATTENGPVGFTCQSFSSLSLEPALVAFNPARSSSTWPTIRATGRFCINILPEEHRELSGKFARSGTDKFSGVTHTTSPLGNPILDSALAWIDCELHKEYDGGDHTIVLGQVKAMNARGEAEPLLFFKGSYVRIGVLV
ncbi:flavin reductase family protein [Arthrobacter sp. NPDC093128]|uniref:flavin reductase family protein n=1 Tax=Arthrobacter sp. NPDC093128 TaxID=3154979 RepID=UPI003444971E